MILDTKYNSAHILDEATFSTKTVSITIEICSTQNNNTLHKGARY
jgi:hypothetical protein